MSIESAHWGCMWQGGGPLWHLDSFHFVRTKLTSIWPYFIRWFGWYPWALMIQAWERDMSSCKTLSICMDHTTCTPPLVVIGKVRLGCAFLLRIPLFEGGPLFIFHWYIFGNLACVSLRLENLGLWWLDFVSSGVAHMSHLYSKSIVWASVLSSLLWSS